MTITIEAPQPVLTPACGGVLLRIRAETALAHRQLEEELALLDDSLDRARYGRIVRAFHAFLAPWEATRTQSLGPSARAFFADRLHAHRAHADLLTLSLAPSDEWCSALPSMESAAAAWGSSYVIEGSTLGGKIITRSVSDSLGLSASDGCTYFAGYRLENGRRWAEFTSAMTQAVPDAEADDAVTAAIATYESLRQWLRASGAMAGAAAGAVAGATA